MAQGRRREEHARVTTRTGRRDLGAARRARDAGGPRLRADRLRRARQRRRRRRGRPGPGPHPLDPDTRARRPAVRAWFEGFGITRATGPVRIPPDPAAGVVRGRICLPVRHRGWLRLRLAARRRSVGLTDAAADRGDGGRRPHRRSARGRGASRTPVRAGLLRELLAGDERTGKPQTRPRPSSVTRSARRRDRAARAGRGGALAGRRRTPVRTLRAADCAAAACDRPVCGAREERGGRAPAAGGGAGRAGPAAQYGRARPGPYGSGPAAARTRCRTRRIR